MIDKVAITSFYREKILPILDTQKYVGRGQMWRELLGVTKDTPNSKVIQLATLSAAGNFNYWEDNGKVNWSSINSSDWFAVIRGEKKIEEMNLPVLRTAFYTATYNFLKSCGTHPDDPIWWDCLSHVFGGDPIKKRETLLWIMLFDMGYSVCMPPEVGCIDYNIMLLCRYHKLISNNEPYEEGTPVDLYVETAIRKDCLLVCHELLLMSDNRLNISKLDDILFNLGRQLRKTSRSIWEPYFCYRFGCYFY